MVFGDGLGFFDAVEEVGDGQFFDAILGGVAEGVVVGFDGEGVFADEVGDLLGDVVGWAIGEVAVACVDDDEACGDVEDLVLCDGLGVIEAVDGVADLEFFGRVGGGVAEVLGGGGDGKVVVLDMAVSFLRTSRVLSLSRSP